MLKDDVKALVSGKINDLTDGADLIDGAVDEIEQIILNYCNIDKVPDGLRHTWMRMAVDLLRYDYAVAHPPTDTGNVKLAGAVSSIKELDTTVSFEGKTDEQRIWSRDFGSHQARLDGLILEHGAQLRAYRKLRW